jgi:hypothetical protein
MLRPRSRTSQLACTSVQASENTFVENSRAGRGEALARSPGDYRSLCPLRLPITVQRLSAVKDRLFLRADPP